MIRNKAKEIAAFVIAAMMAAAITPAMAAPSFASEENTEAATTDAEMMIDEAEEEMVVETEEMTEETEEAVSEESQQEEVICGEAEAAAEPEEGSLTAFASTSPSGADSLTAGQWKSGRFTYSYPRYSGNQIIGTYMEKTFHYYKFRTGSKAGATYTLKAEYTRFTGYTSSDQDYAGIVITLLDSNYNEVQCDDGSNGYGGYADRRLMPNTAGSMTYTHLKQNADYYVKVNSDSGFERNAIDYKVCYTSSDNSGSTPTQLTTPVLTVDKTNITTKDKNNVYVTGTVSCAVGQYLGVYDSNTKIMYDYAQLSNTNGKVSFKVRIPSRYLNDGTQTFTVKSTPLRNIINGSNIVRINVTIGNVSSSTNNQNKTIYPIYKVTVGGSVYEVLQYPEIGGPAARLVQAKNAKSVTVPSTIKFNGVHYSVTGIQPNAFKGSKVKTVTIKTIKLSKSSAVNSLAGSKVKTIKVKTGNKKLNKATVKKYKGVFGKGNCGKKVKVK